MIMSSPAIQRTQSLALYRAFIRSANKITNYNFREHARRKIQADFRSCISLPESKALEKYADGQRQLGIVHRQAVISQLYPDDTAAVASQ